MLMFMKFMGLLLVGSLAALVGCGSPGQAHPFDVAPAPVYTTNFVGDWTDSEKVDVLAGFAEWPRALQFDLDVVRVTDANTHQETCPLEDPRQAAGRTYVGYSYVGTSMCIFIDGIAKTNLPAGALQHVAAHEFGHQLGAMFGSDMHYSGSAPSLMKPEITDDAEFPEPADLAALP